MFRNFLPQKIVILGVTLSLAIVAHFYIVQPALAVGETVGYPTVYHLNIRSGPGTNFSVIDSTYPGQALKLVGRNEHTSWLQISLSNGNMGWVYAAYIQSQANLFDLPVVDNPSQPPGATPVGYVNVRYLNVRAGPGYNYQIINGLRWDTGVTLLGRNAAGSWLQVYLADNNRNGWVAARYIYTTYPISLLPVVDIDPWPTPEPVAYVKVYRLNFRSGPGLTFPIVDRLPRGTQVGLLGRNYDSSWVMVELNHGEVAWVYTYYLRTRYPIADLPLIMN